MINFFPIDESTICRYSKWMSKGAKNAIFWGLSIALFLMPFAMYVLDHPSQKVTTYPSISVSEPTKKVGIEVHMVGALNQPGVYKVAIGTKLHELLDQIMLWPNADLNQLNLAQTLRDGQKITIKATKNQNNDGIVNINLASYKELLALPGIGPTTAKKIMAYRDHHGIIQHQKELMALIGQAKAKKLTNVTY